MAPKRSIAEKRGKVYVWAIFQSASGWLVSRLELCEVEARPTGRASKWMEGPRLLCSLLMSWLIGTCR